MVLCSALAGLLALLSFPATAEAGVEYRSAPGRVAINVDRSEQAEFTAVAALPGGATLAAGFDWIVRLRRDGSLDRSYGDAGVARIDGDGVSKLVAAADGGVSVVTSVPEPLAPDGAAHPAPPRIVRLSPDGRIDRSFGENGVRDLPSLEKDPGTVVAASAADGGLYVGGRRPGTSSAAITRITAAGAIDPGFGAEGVLQLPLRSVVTLETHDGVLVLGWRPDPRVAALYRYDATGKPDQGFGEGRGFVDLIRMTRSFELAVDRKDRIWVHAAMPSSTAGVLRRLLPDGRPDTSFHRGWSRP